eukprot:CAMPEP_0171495000 /NCGR_PEP_ID=MMETSP0958-20121227/5878_1 /TAXON_ID=87120 /ORGANISM="Aurantiochytrium limacinum, Strain ATCCMYA-1381" /LENGTH=62 /DNA_ID=CAMNT_0012028893 /DNA_START=275 /DNA_END=463 /DNA_ORIENTATION=-
MTVSARSVTLSCARIPWFMSAMSTIMDLCRENASFAMLRAPPKRIIAKSVFCKRKTGMVVPR